jgi:hypothetical protein
LCKLNFSDIAAIYEDYHLFTTRHAKLKLLTRLVEGYHIKGSNQDGERALHELMLRLIFELFSGIITLADIDFQRWDISMGRDWRHTERIRRLMQRVHACPKSLALMRCIRWL